MISAIDEWILMIFVIIWTKILTFIQRLLPFFRVYCLFLADMPDWNDMSQDDYTKVFEALPRPLPVPGPPGLLIHEALQARNTNCMYIYHARYQSYLISYMMSWIGFTVR